ncbi:hypothetical protein STEG23_016302 [Scotinomys teguina]
MPKALRERGRDNLPTATFSLWLVKDALLTDRVKVKEQLTELEKEEQERETVASLHEEEREADKNLARSGDLEESDSALGEVKDLDLEDEEERLESEIRGLRKKLQNLQASEPMLVPSAPPFNPRYNVSGHCNQCSCVPPQEEEERKGVQFQAFPVQEVVNAQGQRVREHEFKNFFACMMNNIILEIYDLPKSYLACTLLAFTLIIHTAFKYWFMHKKILSLESANQDLQNRLLNLESANLMQELQSINSKCIAKIGFVDNKYEYLMDRTLILQNEAVTTQTLCKEERLSLIDKIRSLESCVSEEHNRWYDSMKNLESQAREEVHSLEQTLCARLQALEENLCKHDKEPNKQKGSISNLLGIMGIPKDGLQNLANTLEGDKDLNSPRELPAEAKKELALVEKTIREAHVDRVNPELKCILVILPSRHSPTGILMQREDVILEWIFLPHKPNKKLKTYIEKISDLIHKGKLRLHQLTGMDPAEIVVPLTNEEVSSLWKDNEYWQRACSNFLGEINNCYPKSKRIEFIKKTEWVLPHIVQQKPVSGVLTFYTDANKLGKAGYKSRDLSKVVQSPYNSIQKAELYAILMVLMDFTEPLNIVTDSICRESCFTY